MKKVNLLITGIGSAGVYGVIKCLREQTNLDIRIVGFDCDEEIASRYLVDSFYTSPLRHSEAFLPFLDELVQQEKIDVIWPIPTAELELFSRLKPHFEKQGVKVLVSDIDGLVIANNKRFLYEFMQERNHPCQMNFQVISSYDQLLPAMEKQGYPEKAVCVRKAFSTGAQGFRIVDPHADLLDQFLNKNPSSTITSFDYLASFLKSANVFPELIVQEYLPGDEYDVDVLALQGDSLAIIPRINHRMLWGGSLVCETEPHQEIIAHSRDIVRQLNLSYIVSLSFKFDELGNPKLIEINPRVPSSIAITWAAGVNYPALALQLAERNIIEIPDIHWHTKMIRHWEEVYVDQHQHAFNLFSQVIHPPVIQVGG